MLPFPIIIKPGLAVHCWAFVMLGIPTVITAVTTVIHPEENTLPLLVIFLLVGLVYYYWITRHQVIISEDTLSIREPFRRIKSIKFTHIDYIRYYEPGEQYGLEMNLSPIIEVVPVSGEQQDAIRIRLKVFSFHDSELLISILSEKCNFECPG